ncbi:hypothetical protein B566_EDAN017102, partial [Ephemera danica]
SGRQNYGDDAIGYVQVKRIGKACSVLARICPEHKIHSTAYHVEAQIEEKDEFVIIKKISCKECPASKGGCKHSYAFLTWLHRRTEEKPSTSDNCYWKKPALSRAGKEARTAAELKSSKKKQPVEAPDSKHEFLGDFLQGTSSRGVNEYAMLSIHFSDLQLVRHLSVGMAIRNFLEAGGTTAENFMLHLSNLYTDKALIDVEECTRSQSGTAKWFYIKFARWSASNAYEVSHCKTPEGSTVEKLLGARFEPTEAMTRGLKLEEEILEVVRKKHGHTGIKRSGYVLSHAYPLAGCSPDGVSDEAIYEIKSPSKASTRINYIKKNGNLQPKVETQMQIQMLMTTKKMGYLCLASPDFETNHEVELFKLEFDQVKAEDTASKANAFWCKYIFPLFKKSGRQNYGDDAIGYVQVKRVGKACSVLARICPEHKIHSTAYHVEAQIEEKDEFVIIKKISCKECPASKGN